MKETKAITQISVLYLYSLPFYVTIPRRYDTRVWCISGNNLQKGQQRAEGSYYFSRYIHFWQYYDTVLAQWPALRNSGLLDSIF